MEPELTTNRLKLRLWRETDRVPFAAMNDDPVVMEHFPTHLTQSETDAYVDRIRQCFETRGFGLWAVEIDGVTPFAGYVGLWPATFDAHFTPAVEVGWRLHQQHWNHGYATEGARAALDFGFNRLHLEEIVSFTATTNVRSQRVMQKLGMSHEPADDFDHPALPEGHRLQQHVLYRIRPGAPLF
jgi:RimJ/RimL family protein N-acetyltransferase